MIKLEIKEIENLPNKETTKPKLTFRTFKVKKKRTNIIRIKKY